MSSYLEPVVAELKGDVSDFLEKMEAAKAAMRDLNDTAETGGISLSPGPLATDVGEGIEDGISGIGEDVDLGGEEIGKPLGEEIGKGAGRSFLDSFQRIMNETDRLSLKTDEMIEKSRRLGEDSAKAFGSDFDNIVGSEIAAGVTDGAQDAEQEGNGAMDVLGKWKGALIVAGIAAALAALPAVVAGGAAAMTIALGAYIEDQTNPAVAKAFSKVEKTVESGMKKAAAPLAPYLIRAAEQLDHWLVKIGPDFAKAFKDVGPLIQPMVNGLEKMVGNLLPGFDKMLGSPSTAKVVGDISSGIASIGTSLGQMFADFTGSGADASGSFFEDILKGAGKILPVIAKLGGGLAKFFMSFAPFMGPVLKTFKLLGGIIADLEPIFQILITSSLFALDISLGIVNLVLEGFLALLNLIEPYLKDAAEWFSKFCADTIKDITKWAKDVPGFFEHVWTDISHWAVNVYNAIIDAWKHVETDTEHWWNDIYDAIDHFISSIVNYVEDGSEKIYNGFMKGLDNIKNSAVKIFDDVKNGIVGFFKSAGSWLYDAGKNIIQGLINGINNLYHKATNLASSLGKDISNAFTDVVKILSPSRVFYDHGQNIVKGLIGGMQSLHGQAVSTSRNLASGVSNGFNAHANGMRLASASGGSGQPNVTINVAGSILSEKDLRDVVQKQLLQLGARRSTTYQAYGRKVS